MQCTVFFPQLTGCLHTVYTAHFKIQKQKIVENTEAFVAGRKANNALLFGDSGTGKTRSIFASHKPEDICRITDYGGKNGTKFDAYHGQPVLVFEEFHSQIPIAAMLNYLDIYPLQLPARYHDRTACYTTVYITSNISLDEQYTEVQRSELETWRAFLRRIGCVKEFRKGKPPREVPFHDKRR